MLKKLSSLPFCSTPEQDAKLKAVIDANKHDKSRVMAVMQEAQGIYGYLPIEVQNAIAEGMEVPLEKVYGIATFYAQFSLAACRCIGACGLAPVLTINEEVYGRLVTDDVDGIIAKYKN